MKDESKRERALHDKEEALSEYKCGRKCRICPYPGAKCDQIQSNQYETMPHYDEPEEDPYFYHR